MSTATKTPERPSTSQRGQTEAKGKTDASGNAGWHARRQELAQRTRERVRSIIPEELNINREQFADLLMDLVDEARRA